MCARATEERGHAVIARMLSQREKPNGPGPASEPSVPGPRARGGAAQAAVAKPALLGPPNVVHPHKIGTVV